MIFDLAYNAATPESRSSSMLVGYVSNGFHRRISVESVDGLGDSAHHTTTKKLWHDDDNGLIFHNASVFIFLSRYLD